MSKKTNAGWAGVALARRAAAVGVAVPLVLFAPIANAGTGCEENPTAMGAGLGQGPNALGYVASIVQSASGQIYAGGIFDRSGFLQGFNAVAAWNGSSWNRLAGGVRNASSGVGVVLSLVVLPNGDLVAGGGFDQGAPLFEQARNVARWNGTTWSPMGVGFNDLVYALAVLPNGDVIAGGTFNLALQGNGVIVNRVARWNGSSWVAMAGGMSLPPNSPPCCQPTEVRSLAVTATGDVIAGGRFGIAGSAVANGIARWNGTEWHSLGAGVDGAVPGAQSIVDSVAVHPDGSILAAGTISVLGDPSQRHLLSWDGVSWSQVGDPLDTQPRSVFVRDNGDIIVLGSLNAGSVFLGGVGLWNGTHWSPIGTGISGSFAANPGPYVGASLADGSIAIGGSFALVGDEPAFNIVRFQFPESCPCDSIDFNNNGTRFEPIDIEAFLSVYTEGPCQPDGFNLGCNDIDFNNDGSFFDPCDFESFLLVFSEGPCTPCGV